MHVDVVSIGVKVGVEDQGRVHERTGVDQAAPLTNLHLLHIEDEAPVEDVEGRRALATEEDDLVVSDLVRKAHVRGHPVGLVAFGSANFLPHISGDVVNFDCVNDALLVDSSSEGEDVVVLKDAKGGSSTRNSHIGDELPLILLGIVNLTVAVHLVADKGANDIDKVLNGANRMIRVGIVHVAHLVQDSKKIIVSVAILQINAHMLDISTSQVNRACFGSN